MTRPSFVKALAGCAAGLGVAAVLNAALALLAGDTLVIPGELGVGTIVLYTLVMIAPATLVLWLAPRWFVPVVLAVAVLTLPFPYAEFGLPVALWLGGMHLIAGVCAALIAPRVVGARTAQPDTR